MTQKLNKLDAGLEFKFAESEGGGGRITGYASLFNQRDQGGDMVLPGAYTKSLGKRGLPKMLYQHDPSRPMGAWDVVEEDQKGLRVEGDICLDCAVGRESASLIRMKAMSGLSIGYMTKAATKDASTGGRNLMELDLWEISLVTFPMQATAGVDSIKSLDEIDQFDLSDLDYHLREAGGFSRNEAKRLLHRHAALLDQRQADIELAASRKAAIDGLRRALDWKSENGGHGNV